MQAFRFVAQRIARLSEDQNPQKHVDSLAVVILEHQRIDADPAAPFFYYIGRHIPTLARVDERKEIAFEPSPTPDATRLTLQQRTSPAANTPGRLVSRRNGVRARGQCALLSSSGVKSGPVLMNPFLSSTTRLFSHVHLVPKRCSAGPSDIPVRAAFLQTARCLAEALRWSAGQKTSNPL